MPKKVAQGFYRDCRKIGFRARDITLARKIAHSVYKNCRKRGFSVKDAKVWKEVFLRAFSEPVPDIEVEFS